MTDIESQVSTNDTIVCLKMIYIIGMYAFVIFKNTLKI